MLTAAIIPRMIKIPENETGIYLVILATKLFSLRRTASRAKMMIMKVLRVTMAVMCLKVSTRARSSDPGGLTSSRVWDSKEWKMSIIGNILNLNVVFAAKVHCRVII